MRIALLRPQANRAETDSSPNRQADHTLGDQMPAHERHRAVSRRQAHHVVDPSPAAPVGTRESRWEEEIVALVGAIHPQADFYVVVRGDSMSSVGYRTGDIIAIKRTPDAAEGDVVMVRIGTEITLKCFHRPADDGVELKPCSSNPEHQPIVIDERTEDWEIVGVVVGAMIGPPRQSPPGP